MGAGIGGLTAAARLIHHGHDVTLVERRPGPPPGGAGIVVHPNALADLRRVVPEIGDHGHRIAAHHLPTVDGRRRSVDWSLVWPGGELPVAIHRTVLVDLLLARIPRAQVRWGREVTGLVDKGTAVQVGFDDAPSSSFDIVLAADGIGSTTREHVLGPAARHPLRQAFWRAVVPRSEHLDVDDWHTWAVEDLHFGAIPIGPQQLHLFVQAPRRPAPDADARDEVLHLLRSAAHPVAARFIAALDAAEVDVREAEGLLAPRWVEGRIALVGDAAHAVSPATSQGGGLAIGDALAVADSIALRGAGPEALRAYEERRRPAVQAFVRRAELHLRLSQVTAGAPRARRSTPVTSPDAWYRRLYEPLMAS